MRVIADTSIWSMWLRRRPNARLSNEQRLLKAELRELGEEDRLVMLGVIRQELLTGIRTAGHFKRVMNELRAFDDYPLKTSVHESAAELANECLNRGVVTAFVDILICTVAKIEDFAVFSSDPDIERICRIVSVVQHAPRKFEGPPTV